MHTECNGNTTEGDRSITDRNGSIYKCNGRTTRCDGSTTECDVSTTECAGSTTGCDDRRNGLVVRASASQSVDLGLISQVESYQKMVVTASLLGALHIGIVWKTSRQACLLCP